MSAEVQDKKKESEKSIYDKIDEIRAGRPGSITYYYEDGVILSQQNINREVFKKLVKGKLVTRTAQEVLKVFQDTMHDNGARYFIVD